MRSGMIGKIEKAHRYAMEPERFRVQRMEVCVSGDNGDHVVTLEGGRWRCPCDFFRHNEACAHSMALERMYPAITAEPHPQAIPA